MTTQRTFNRMAWILAGMLALGVLAPHRAWTSSARWPDQCAPARAWSKVMHICIDLTDMPRVVGQSQLQLLANRPVTVHVRAWQGTAVRVSLSGEAGLVQQTTGGEATHDVNSRVARELVFHLAPRLGISKETTLTLKVESWNVEEPAAGTGRRQRIEELLADFTTRVAPEADDAVVHAELEVLAAEVGEAGSGAADGGGESPTPTPPEAPGATQTNALEGLRDARLAKDLVGRAIVDLTWLKSADGLAKVAGITLYTEIPEIGPSGDPLKTVAAIAVLRAEVEQPPITTLEAPITYNKGIVAGFNVGTAVVLAPRSRSYEAVENEDGEAILTETTGGTVDMELVATYTQYLYAVPDVPNARFIGVSGGLAFASLDSQSGLPLSVYLGGAVGYRNISLGLYAVVRDVPELRAGAQVDDEVLEGADLPLNHGYRPGCALVINFTPELFNVKR